MAGESQERNGRLQRSQHTQADAHVRSIIAVTVRIATSYLANNPIPSKKIGPLIRQIGQTPVSLRNRPQETASPEAFEDHGGLTASDARGDQGLDP
ncbi:hypothetical protein [Methylorubrum sp. SB2]|uniref:hypothetical protein n=1 Tax=Methylorubrum subtropicum TaxID=3138812 RepID=UPI00313F209F